MFTGIVEALGKVHEVIAHTGNISFWVESPFTDKLKVDESVSHNGVCLTVEEKRNNFYRVTAIEETLQKTNLGDLKKEETINLERAMKLGSRLDGHIVQGHVDGTGVCTEISDKDGSRIFRFSMNKKFAELVVNKGSICVDGVSLTVVDCERDFFTVAIIPYTFEHTNFSILRIGNKVNLEFDILGKYILRRQELMK